MGHDGRWLDRTAAAALACLAMISADQSKAQRPDAPYTGNLVPQGSPIPRILPPTPLETGPGPTLAPPAPPQAPRGENVAVRDVVVVGATAFPEARIETLLAGLTGPAVPVRRIEAARNAVLLLYRNHGYLLTNVNARLDPSGTLRFVVVEGHIVDVKLDGDIGPAGVQVLRFLRHLTEEPVLDNASLERWLLLAQEIPGVTVKAVLRPSPDDPGSLTLVAQVSRQAVSGLLAVDNRASRLTGTQEGLAVIDLNSFTQFGERTEFSLYHTNGNTQNFGQWTENFFVGGSGLQVRLFAGVGKATPSDYLRAIDYEGFTNTLGIAALYPVIRSRQQSLDVSIDIDAIESEIKALNGTDAAVTRISRDSLRVGRLLAQYAISDVLLGGARQANNVASLRLSQGLPFLGGTSDDNPLPGRLGEQVGFTSISFELSRTQSLFAPWNGATLSLKGELLGQASPDVLPPAEQFFLGGTDFDRGYYAGEVTGDQALAETAELDLDTSVLHGAFGHPVNVGSEYYVFYDRGNVWQNKATTPNALLSSEGIGARVTLTRFLELDIEGDIRNTRLPSGSPGAVKPLKADAAFWRILARF